MIFINPRSTTTTYKMASKPRGQWDMNEETLKTAIKIVSERINDDWIKLAQNLKLPLMQIRMIDGTQPKNISKARAVLRQWEQSTEHFDWETLRAALEATYRLDIIRHIEKQYMKDEEGILN